MSKPPRLFIQQNRRLSIMQIFGAIILLFGLICLIGIAFFQVLSTKHTEPTFAAIGFFLIMMGFALLFPDMLKGPDKGDTSTMRVAVFMIISVFVMMVVKVYWNATPKEFELDRTWAYIIGVALGSKAVQSLGENNAAGKSGFLGINRPQKNPLANMDPPVSDLPFGDDGPIGPAPGTPPSSLIPKNNS